MDVSLKPTQEAFSDLLVPYSSAGPLRSSERGLLAAHRSLLKPQRRRASLSWSQAVEEAPPLGVRAANSRGSDESQLERYRFFKCCCAGVW